MITDPQTSPFTNLNPCPALCHYKPQILKTTVPISIPKQPCFNTNTIPTILNLKISSLLTIKPAIPVSIQPITCNFIQFFTNPKSIHAMIQHKLTKSSPSPSSAASIAEPHPAAVAPPFQIPSHVGAAFKAFSEPSPCSASPLHRCPIHCRHNAAGVKPCAPKSQP
jgi:hypothetical protein